MLLFATTGKVHEEATGLLDTRSRERIDTTNHVIRGVKLIGIESRNPARVLGLSESDFGNAVDRPYRYSLEGLRQAASLYENAKVYLDHTAFKIDDDGRRVVNAGDTQRSNQLLGWVQNVTAHEDGLYGDLHYLDSHPFAARLVELADRNPKIISLSHEAVFGDPQLIDGRVVLNEITAVERIALISERPGTTNGLFESFAQGKRPMKRTLRTILESAPAGTKGREALAKLIDICDRKIKTTRGIVAEMDDKSFDDMATAMPDTEVPEATPPVDAGAGDTTGGEKQPHEHIADGLRAAINKALDDADADTLKKVLAALGLSDSLAEHTAGGGDTTGEDMADEDFTTAESQMAAKVILECVAVLREHGAEPTPVILEGMVALPKAKRAEFAKNRADVKKPWEYVPTPRSSGVKARVHESAAPKFNESGSLAEFMRRPFGG